MEGAGRVIPGKKSREARRRLVSKNLQLLLRRRRTKVQHDQDFLQQRTGKVERSGINVTFLLEESPGHDTAAFSNCSVAIMAQNRHW